VGPGAFVNNIVGETDLVYTAVVATDDGRVRYATAVGDPFEADPLVQAVARACYPLEDEFEAGRPNGVLVGDERLAGLLRPYLSSAGVPVEVGDDEVAKGLHAQLVPALHPEAGEPYLATASPARSTASSIRRSAFSTRSRGGCSTTTVTSPTA
jgi:hypothetical protein